MAIDDPRQVLSGQSDGQSRLRYIAGKIICQQGDPANVLFYVERGHIAISVVSPTGNEAVIGLRGQGDFFAVRSLMSGSRRLLTATALTESTIVRIRKSAAAILLRERSEFAEMFIAYLLRQKLRDQENIINQLTNGAEGRLARTLLQIADWNATGTGEIQLDQTMLANLIGATRGRVNFIMNKFKRHGLIEYDRRGIVIARDALLKALGDVK